MKMLDNEIPIMGLQVCLNRELLPWEVKEVYFTNDGMRIVDRVECGLWVYDELKRTTKEWED